MQTTTRLIRSKENGMIAGVCAGIAEYFRVDPTLVRVGLVAFTLMGGAGIFLYVILWLVMPEA
jgi:phage shock protein C